MDYMEYINKVNKPRVSADSIESTLLAMEALWE